MLNSNDLFKQAKGYNDIQDPGFSPALTIGLEYQIITWESFYCRLQFKGILIDITDTKLVFNLSPGTLLRKLIPEVDPNSIYDEPFSHDSTKVLFKKHVISWERTTPYTDFEKLEILRTQLT